MSKSHYLEKLLDGAEVEWVPLDEVATLKRGRVMSKGYLIENAGDYPVYSSQTANDGMIGRINSFDFEGEFISWTTDGANAGTVFYRTGKFSITNVCGLIKINNELQLSYKFLFYWLSIEAQKHVYSGMGNPKLMSHQVRKILIPIPCPNNPQKSLAIQTEIARILDSFTALTTELTTELSLRQKQYQYYRDLLLDFDDGEVEWVPLSKLVFVIAAPVKLKKEMYQNSGEIPIIDQGAKFIAGYTNEEIEPVSDNEYIIFGDHSEHIKYVDFAFVQGADGLKILKPISNNTKYIYHAFTNFYQKELNYKRHWSKAKETPIPIPCPNNPQKSLAIQTEIARILDAFTELTTELTTELSLRQKQYQYYRDLLLSFD